MKTARMLLFMTVAMISIIGTISAVDYKRGEVDSDGRNLWHKVAERCADDDFNTDSLIPRTIEVSPQQGERLVKLTQEKDNNGNTPMDIAAEKLGQTFSPRCYELMKRFAEAKELQENN